MRRLALRAPRPPASARVHLTLGARPCLTLGAHPHLTLGSLSAELYAALSDFKLGVSEADVDAIFIELDEDDSGTVDFYELLQMIGPRLSHDRNAVVMQAFYKVQSELLNGDEAAAVDAKCFRDGYNAQHHPSVIDGLMAKEMAHIEFLDTFNDMFEVRSMVRAVDFKGYYQLISAGISSDSEFIEVPSRRPAPSPALCGWPRLTSALSASADGWQLLGCDQPEEPRPAPLRRRAPALAAPRVGQLAHAARLPPPLAAPRSPALQRRRRAPAAGRGRGRGVARHGARLPALGRPVRQEDRRRQ